MRLCVTCKVGKPLTEFNRRSKAKDGLQTTCRGCNAASSRAYYAKNRDHHKEVCSRIKDKRVAENRKRLWAILLASACSDCGNKDPRVLDFDHLRDKEFHVSTAIHEGYGWKRIEAEIAKCKVRCANCHRIKTNEELGLWRSVMLKPDAPKA